MSNIVLQGVPEEKGKSAEERYDSDKTLVSELLTELEVTTKPIKIFRLGQYTESENSTGIITSRPIKIEFPNSEPQERAMQNAYKLQHASENLKKSVCAMTLQKMRGNSSSHL